ncbi:MerR family transcriptional regulator [Arthrobacter castelli]|uniref:MerR family transcriptional regulator n=1 Tax=Arthrobacter castelli TaxID=271431 RepID=UPI000685536E|nr:MerR family transcriptional regulator [Arthrobacter castelli]
MKVKELADLARTTVRTVRYYHQINLLPLPETRHGWRDYGFAHVARLMRVRWLVDSGVPLAQVKELIAAETQNPARSSVAADLRATLEGVDRQLDDLRARRAQLATLLQTAESGRPLTPVPEPLARFYADLLDLAPDERARGMIQAEADLVEMACYRMELPPIVCEVIDRITKDDLDEAVEMIAGFQRVADNQPPDAEDQIRALAAWGGEFARRVAPELLAAMGDMLTDGRHAWTWRIFALVYPGSYYPGAYFTLYVETLAEELGIPLSAEDRRALAESAREENQKHLHQLSRKATT